MKLLYTVVASQDSTTTRWSLRVTEYLIDVLYEFRRHKELTDWAMGRLSEEELLIVAADTRARE